MKRYLQIWALAAAVLLMGAFMAFAKVTLPGHVQETVDTVIAEKLNPVVLAGPAIKEFGAELVLAYGEQAALPEGIAYIVLVDTREGVGTPLPSKASEQTIMAFNANGDFVGAAKVETVFVKASLDQFDKERDVLKQNSQPDQAPDKGI